MHTSMMMAAGGYYTYTGREDEIIPHDVTRIRIYESLTAIPRHAFYGRRNIEEVICDRKLKQMHSLSVFL
jgi:hypothetical protein